MTRKSFDPRTLDPRLFDVTNHEWFLQVPDAARSYVYRERARARAERRELRRHNRIKPGGLAKDVLGRDSLQPPVRSARMRAAK